MKSQSFNMQSSERPTPLRRAGSTIVAYGDNVVAGICGSGETCKRNAYLLVSEITRRIFRDFPSASADGRCIVESLVWPFVARVSRRETWFTEVDYQRFYKSARLMAVRVLSYDKPGSVAQKYVKYWTDRYLQLGMRDVNGVPPSADFGVSPLFSGYMHRFVKRAIARHDLSFLYSLQKGSKRMWKALDWVCERAALVKHKERLTTKKCLTPKVILDRIKRVSYDTFHHKVESSKFMPSGSACVQASVKDGGALHLFEPFQPDTSVGLLSLNASLHRWRVQEHASALEDVRLRVESDPLSANTVQVVAIAEPGKFRIITKGDGYLYSALQPIQGHMLTSWKCSSASTMRDMDLSESVKGLLQPVGVWDDTYESYVESEEINGLLGRMNLWASVDYEAATDLLNKDATIAAMAGLEEHPLYELLRLSFGRGKAEYSLPTDQVTAKGKRKREPVESTFDEGQLMGHPCSFPLLCVINQSVWEQSLWEWLVVMKKEGHLRSVGVARAFWYLNARVLVNGDDMLFPCDLELYSIFRRISSSVGFKSSDGKNYLSPNSCMINSQVFKISGSFPHVSVTRCGYLNMKLVTGHNLKKGSDDEGCLPTQVGGELAKMVDLCPWTSCAIAYAFSRFKSLNFGFRPNWFMPVSLGGFGYWQRDVTPRYTREQRRVAAMFVADGDLSLYRKTGASSKLLRRFSGALGSWGWQRTAGPLERHYSEDNDPWVSRLTYASRAMRAGSVGRDASHSIPVMIRRDYRLKAMDVDTIEKYRNMRRVRVAGPVLPPLGEIRNRANWARGVNSLAFFTTRSSSFLVRDEGPFGEEYQRGSTSLNIFKEINDHFWRTVGVARDGLGNLACTL